MAQKNRAREHRFFDRNVVFGTVVIIAGAYILPELTGAIVEGIVQIFVPWFTPGILMGILSLVYILFFTRWFKPDFKGIMGMDGMKEGFRLLIPYASVVIIGLVELKVCGVYEGIKYSTFALAIMAGVCEEVAFRGAPGAYLMRMAKDEGSIMRNALILSAVFGLIHMSNVLQASLPMTIYQTLGAFCVGMLYCAVFFRTGCLWPVIAAHFINDFIAFLDTSRVQEGIVQGSTFVIQDYIDMVLCAAFLIYAIYLLRPDKRSEIAALWRNKWNLTLEEEKIYE